MSPAATQGGKEAAGQPGRVSPQGFGRAFRLSRCATPIRSPAGERVRWTGCFKQPALTVSWRLLVFHLINEEWASARCPSLNSPVETVSPPLFPVCCAWTPTKYNTRFHGGSRKQPD